MEGYYVLNEASRQIDGSLLRESKQEYPKICIIRFCDLGMRDDAKDARIVYCVGNGSY